MTLPITPLLPKICATLRDAGRAVLQAPPGAGKTTQVPLALLETVSDGKILMLEPRRLAARAAADRLAAQLGEKPGDTVGYRMRGDSKTGRRIEVVTEGILTRMIQSDPELPGVACVIFDEFHERSLNADLGLALTWEVRQALRPDLLVLVMSATLDAGPVAALLDEAPILTAEGRAHLVQTIWLDRPRPARAPLAPNVSALIHQAAAEGDGGILVFLPGEREIRQVGAALAADLPSGCAVRPLYGALPFSEQRAAIAPDPTTRKIVLATSIAETSLTIEDIRAVVDAGLARRSRFDPGTGMSRLVTEPATRAEITQRAGRAGRTAPGRCYRLWAKAEEGARPAYPPPEIAAADLSGLALELALWGSADLGFLTPPPEGAMRNAQSLLQDLGALDAGTRITDHGRALARLPVHPRLGHMLLVGGRAAAPLAALLADRDPMPGHGADLMVRVKALHSGRDIPKRITTEAKRLRKLAPDTATDLTYGQIAALAYPDRIGQRRKGDAARYVLTGGRGAVLDAADTLAAAPFLVATDLDGGGREARIRLALSLTEVELREVAAERITRTTDCAWSRRSNAVETREQERLGAVILSDRRWAEAPDDQIAMAMLDGIRQLGITLTGAAARFRARVELARRGGADLPDMSDDRLLDGAEDWLLPHLSGIRTAGQWRSMDLLPALQARLDWGQMQSVDRVAPAHFTTPLGRKVPINYDSDPPEISLRLQELFGQTQHPTVGDRPLKLTLLSPAQRPIQITTDLPGFWASSYADVRKDMRSQYPKHPWPVDPTEAKPTTRTKAKGGGT